MNDTPFSIIEAENGEEALKLLANQNPDLILMDLRMPGRSGYEVTGIIKNDNKVKHLPVIAVTASAMKETEEILIPLFDGYVRKPFNRSELFSELRKHLPHTLKKIISVPAEKGTERESVCTESLSHETVARLPEPIQILEDECVAEWEDIRETLIFDEIEEFADQIREQGMKYDYPPLVRWSEMMIRKMQNFDMETLPAMFGKFPEIIEDIRKITADFKNKEENSDESERIS